MSAVRFVEGVRWYRHVVRYTLSDGRRQRMVRWSPGFHWVREEVTRELVDRFGFEGIKQGSISISMQERRTTMTKKREKFVASDLAAESFELGGQTYFVADAFFAVEFRAGDPQWEGYRVIHGTAASRVARLVLAGAVGASNPELEDVGFCVVVAQSDGAEAVNTNLANDSTILAYAEMPVAAVRRLAMRGV